MFYLALMIAGGFGVLLRYSLGQAAIAMHWTSLPFGTLIANLMGCFLIGFLSLWLVERVGATQQLQTIILTGFLGGFTTFSAFSLEAITMFQQGSANRALIYIGAKVILCIFMCLLGLLVAKQCSA